MNDYKLGRKITNFTNEDNIIDCPEKITRYSLKCFNLLTD